MKDDRYTDMICKRFCAFYKSGKEEMQCGSYLFLKELFSPEDLESSLADIPDSPSFSEDGSIRELVCGRCDFLVDGCDFREGNDAPPCGGYVIIEHVLKTKSED